MSDNSVTHINAGGGKINRGSDRSNWNVQDIRESSHPEPDESIYPSRIAKTKVGVWIPASEVIGAKVFCASHNILLQDLTSLGWKLAMAEVAGETGRPVDQSTSRPTPDQISDLRQRTEIETDQNPLSDDPVATGRPVDQLDEIIETFRSKIPSQAFGTWVKPLAWRLTAEGPVLTAPNSIVRDWILAHYAGELAAATHEHGFERFSWDTIPEPGCAPSARGTGVPPVDHAAGESKLSATERKDELLSFYAVVTSNQLRPYDVEDFELVAGCSADSVKSGILRSQLKVDGGKVRKFKYCVKAILQIEKAGLGLILLPKLERQWQQSLPGFDGSVVPLKRGR